MADAQLLIGFGSVTRTPLDLPPAVARSFVKDMKASFAEEDGHRRDAIAGHQLSILANIRSRVMKGCGFQT